MKKKIAGRFIETAIVAAAVLLTVSAVHIRKSDVPKMTGTEVIYVHSGQTLWDIADEYCPAGIDKREWIYAVQKRNEINMLMPGKLEVIQFEH